MANKEFDWLVVGAGLSGATFANIMTQYGKKVFVIDRRRYLGGNCFIMHDEHIPVHYYGAHIFHTSNDDIMNFVKNNSDSCNIQNFINTPKAISGGKLYDLPFNMNTFYKIFSTYDVEEVRGLIDDEKILAHIKHPQNLEEKAISLVGKTIYNTLIKGYTEKQWGRKCTKLSPNIITRLPLRFTFNNNYFNDKYQFTMDYTQFVKNLLKDCEVMLCTSFDDIVKSVNLNKFFKNIYYTGSIDELCDYKYGQLPYRTVREEIVHDDGWKTQGNAVINYIDKDIPYTRVIEHKLLSNMVDNLLPINIFSYEYPEEFDKNKNNGIGRAYPIATPDSAKTYEKYLSYLHGKHPNIVLGGRLGTYNYWNMDKAIEMAMKQAKQILKAEENEKDIKIFYNKTV